MKYFTIKWWQGRVADQMEVCRKYERYMKSVEARLPTNLKRLYYEVTLHDSHLRRMRSTDQSLDLHLDGERWENGNCHSGRRFHLSYRGVHSFISIANPKSGLGGPHGYGDLGYNEIEIIRDDLFEHRILFSSGIEFRIRFATFSLEYEDAAPRNRRGPARGAKRLK